jgi:hypothetical protein
MGTRGCACGWCSLMKVKQKEWIQNARREWFKEEAMGQTRCAWRETSHGKGGGSKQALGTRFRESEKECRKQCDQTLVIRGLGHGPEYHLPSRMGLIGLSLCVE